MSNIFGLYVGNSTASIAIYKEEGKVDVIANQNGERVTPASVSISTEEKVVGPSSISFSSASSTVTNNKRLLDCDLNLEDLEQYIAESSVPLNSDNGVFYTISEPEKKTFNYSPVQVAVLIFKKLYNIGVGACSQKNLSCVLCAPRSWNVETRKVLEEAAEKAGWNVLQTINEAPTALMAYRIGFDKPLRDMNVLVYRLGGVSCEASVVSVEEGMYSILSSVQNRTGGNVMVKALADHLVEEFSRKYYLDPRDSRKSLFKFRNAAQSILQTLSTVPTSSRFIESACEGVDFNVSVSVARFNSLISPLLPNFAAPIHKALEDAKLTSSDISKVILCGGCLKVPKIRSYVSSFFECESLCSISPDEVFACGAAEQAGLIYDLGEKMDSTADVPFLSSPVVMKFGDEEIVLDKMVIPKFHQISLEPKEEPLEISVLQGSVKGTANLDPVNASSGLNVNLKITTQGGMHIETVNPSNNESLKGFIEFTLD